MPASWRTFTQAARHCSSKPYSRSNSASVSPRMIARIVPNSPFTTILPSYSQKYNGRGDWLISGFGDEQGRRPCDKAIEPDRLEKIEEHQHDRALAVARAEDLGNAPLARILVVGRFWGRQRAPGFGLGPGLDPRHHLFGLLDPALLREPARAFGQAEADPPDDDRGD